MVGSVQIRNRATLAGNLCNASPAADTAPALLVHGAMVVAAGPDGTRRIPLDEFFVRSGVTTLRPGELVTADRAARAGRRASRAPTSVGRAGGATTWRRSRWPAAWTRRASPGSRTAASGRGRCSAWTRPASLGRPGATDEARAAVFEAHVRGRQPVRPLDARRPRVPARDAAGARPARARPRRSSAWRRGAGMIATLPIELTVNGRRRARRRRAAPHAARRAARRPRR